VISEAPGRSQGGQTSFGVALKLPFATDDRNLPLEAAALTELDLAETQQRRVRDRLEAELATAQAAEAGAQAQEAAERARAALLRERAQLIDKSFRAGESPLPELLRALAASAQADANLARQTAALGLARARLQQASGQLP
jgi:outer membrane protein TolC